MTDTSGATPTAEEVEVLRRRIAELEAQVALQQRVADLEATISTLMADPRLARRLPHDIRTERVLKRAAGDPTVG